MRNVRPSLRLRLLLVSLRFTLLISLLSFLFQCAAFVRNIHHVADTHTHAQFMFIIQWIANQHTYKSWSVIMAITFILNPQLTAILRTKLHYYAIIRDIFFFSLLFLLFFQLPFWLAIILTIYIIFMNACFISILGPSEFAFYASKCVRQLST